MDRSPRDARTRGPVDEARSSEPVREHYAAARRWLACARAEVRWAEEGPLQEAAAGLARACEALLQAERHRGWARRWRRSGVVTAKECSLCGTPFEGEAGVCEACGGDEDAAERVCARESIRGYYAAARHTLKLVRLYRSEPGTSGRREKEALREVKRQREAIKALREGLREALESDKPGLRKAGGEGAETEPSGRRQVG